ncbi:MAG: hypothetical protein LC785_16175 [Acidobacteria bacterium]|nr:hypothetical protein [Acidobacteriota bacterium]MCA1643441.1 hypothetical protein [Acidobacteriota bacterium]
MKNHSGRPLVIASAIALMFAALCAPTALMQGGGSSQTNSNRPAPRVVVRPAATPADADADPHPRSQRHNWGDEGRDREGGWQGG